LQAIVIYKETHPEADFSSGFGKKDTDDDKKLMDFIHKTTR